MKYISDHIKPILAIIIVLSGILYIYLITFLPTKTTDSQGLIAMINFMALAIGYYLGTSTGNSKKDDTISDLAKNNKN